MRQTIPHPPERGICLAKFVAKAGNLDSFRKHFRLCSLFSERTFVPNGSLSRGLIRRKLTDADIAVMQAAYARLLT